jgi:hypothetical protein
MMPAVCYPVRSPPMSPICAKPRETIVLTTFTITVEFSLPHPARVFPAFGRRVCWARAFVRSNRLRVFECARLRGGPTLWRAAARSCGRLEAVSSSTESSVSGGPRTSRPPEGHGGVVVAAYHGRLSRARLQGADLRTRHRSQGKAATDNIATLKKGDMADRAAGPLTGTGWLPAMLRAA